MTARVLLELFNAELAARGMPLATLAEGEPEEPNGEQTITVIIPVRRNGLL